MMKVSKRTFWILGLIGCTLATTSSFADIVTLTPFEDATISENSPESPLGGDNTIVSGSDGPEQSALRNRALLKYDIGSSIPSNAIVTSAALTLALVKTPRTTSLWFSLHKVLQDWSESAVTWTNRLSPSANWSAPGGAPPLDYSSLITQSNLIIGTIVPAPFTFVSNPAMVADVQAWVSNPTNNFGWILICESEALERTKRYFAASEYAINSIPTNQPSLVVQFILPTMSPTLTALPLTNGQFQFLFIAESNRTYTAEYCRDLVVTNWVVLTNIMPLLAPAEVIVSDAGLIESNRFYRIRMP